jgi:hypothetical protein
MPDFLFPVNKTVEKEFWTSNVDLETHTKEIVCTDGDKGDGLIEPYPQKIEFTDFPIKQIKLYVIEGGENKIFMVPS